MQIQYMHKRDGFWYYIRWVPRAVAHRHNSPFVRRSTGIRIADDPRGITARTRVLEMDADQTLHWNDLAAGRDPGERQTYQRCLRIADKYAVPYLLHTDVAKLPLQKFATRMRLCESNPREEIVATMMGTVDKPSLKLSRLVDEYAKLNQASLNAKSPNQLKKWRVARESSLQALISIIGSDIDLSDVQRSHALALRNHWNELAALGKIKIESANKYLGRLSALFKAVTEAHQLDNATIFDKLYIRDGKTGKRHSFANDWVQSTLLADGALDGLNEEARAIVYLMVETGIRLVEACNLDRGTIVLDHEIPHIQIRPNGRELKTDQSERDIPLVGVALMAMRKHTNGFPRYRDKNAQASAAINAYFRSNFALDANQSLYSLRHTFKNRLRSIRCQDEISARLMGHEYDLPDYGEPSLEDKLYWLKKIAFRPPSRV